MLSITSAMKKTQSKGISAWYGLRRVLVTHNSTHDGVCHREQPRREQKQHWRERRKSAEERLPRRSGLGRAGGGCPAGGSRARGHTCTGVQREAWGTHRFAEPLLKGNTCQVCTRRGREHDTLTSPALTGSAWSGSEVPRP